MKHLLISLFLLSVSDLANATLIQNGYFNYINQPNYNLTATKKISSVVKPSMTSPKISNITKGANQIELNNFKSNSFNIKPVNKTKAQSATSTAGLLHKAPTKAVFIAKTLIILEPIPTLTNFELMPVLTIFEPPALNNHSSVINMTDTGIINSYWLTENIVNPESTKNPFKLATTNIDIQHNSEINRQPPNAVPVPAAIWLFGSALGLFGFARRSSV